MRKSEGELGVEAGEEKNLWRLPSCPWENSDGRRLIQKSWNGGDLCPSRLIESLIKRSLTILSHLGARTIKWLPCFQGKSETSLTYGSPAASERHRCAVLMGGAQTRWRRTSGQVKDEAECHMWPQGQSLGEPGEDSVGREQGLKSKTDVCSLSGSNVHIVPT